MVPPSSSPDMGTENDCSDNMSDESSTDGESTSTDCESIDSHSSNEGVYIQGTLQVLDKLSIDLNIRGDQLLDLATPNTLSEATVKYLEEGQNMIGLFHILQGIDLQTFFVLECMQYLE